MSQAPSRPKVYHITHVDNLARIVTDGELLCDAEMIKRGGPEVTIGFSAMKQNRLAMPVKCHPGDSVGDYVPFYFCPRSVMLYLYYANNDPRLTYRGGQEPIVHLEADFYEAVAWANAEGSRWAFTLSNAGAAYTEFRADARQLDEVDWDAVAARIWYPRDTKESKQAEFLMHQSFPWALVSRIGVKTSAIRRRVEAALTESAEMPVLEVRPDWYYS